MPKHSSIGRPLFSLLAATAALTLSLSASALAVGDMVPVTNGEFNGITGWSLINPTGEYFTGFAPARSGNLAGTTNFGVQQLDGWGGRKNAGGVFQDIGGLTVGAQYELSFYSLVNHTDDPKATEHWDVAFGNQTLQSTTISTNGVWVKDTLTFTATSSTQRLSFAGIFLGYTPGATPEVLNLDGITLKVSAVPEPATAALSLGGLLAVGFLAKRRRKGQQA
ncbi:PEP-CTERM sorting domain-containing protein [Pelomonas sp. KK5]|uniref:PEP-CTERM sorting domain-containing protein n=1 Tax=Pelomonas sp. KK5 TaxID=1855730 RepID=UPI00097CB7E1|nr:PEP-CTERM sorting domain-containing protein [Pelomonas sp. KK5]